MVVFDFLAGDCSLYELEEKSNGVHTEMRIWVNLLITLQKLWGCIGVQPPKKSIYFELMALCIKQLTVPIGNIMIHPT